MYKTVVPLILASQSPRRRQLLSMMGIDFSLASADIEELQEPGEEATDFVVRMAQCKALCVAGGFPDTWVLAADTIVVIDGDILGKPFDSVDACRMLGRLSGCWHKVLTAFTLHHRALSKTISMVDSTRVKISTLNKVEISAYVASGEPLDKAGSYAVQGIGGSFVEALDGSPTTVIGLPLPLVTRLLLNYNIISLINDN